MNYMRRSNHSISQTRVKKTDDVIEMLDFQSLSKVIQYWDHEDNY